MKRLLTNYITPLFCGILLLGSVQLNASHFMGGNITYSCVGPNQFAFTVTLYRDCNGATMPTSLNMTATSASCGLSFPFTLELVTSSLAFPNPAIVTPICPGEIDVCAPGPGGTYGVERYIYAYVPNGPQGSSTPPVFPASCTDWVISAPPLNARNSAISTGPNGNLYLESTLNNADAPCNNSPLFLNDPVPFVCVGSNVNFSHGVTEFDGDSLAFSLTPCLNAANNPVNYNPPYSSTSPLQSASGININAQTGAITFTPTLAQVTVICVLVEEYRNGVKIGDVLRDIQFTILNCTNPLPVATSSSTVGSFNLTVCEGDSIDFTLVGSDANGDNIDMFWNAGITSPGASFTVTNNNSTAPVGRFRWVTDRNSSGFYLFTVTLQDDACPTNGVNVFTYSIDVRDIPDVDAGPYQISCAAGDTVLLTGVPNSLDSLFEWSTLFGGSITDPTSLSTQLVPVPAGAYKLIKTYKYGCVDSSLVSVDISPGDTMPALTDANLCLGDSIQLDATVIVNTTPPTTFSNNTVVPFGASADTTFSTIDVFGIQPGIFSVAMLQDVCVNITYPAASFLSLSLISPNGTVIDLSSGNGGASGTGSYPNVCFTPNFIPAMGTPGAGQAPYNGTYGPEQAFTNLTNEVVNGTWTLRIINSQGIPLNNTLNSWNITFLDITDAVTYDWTPTTDLSCTTCPNPWASPTVPTTYQVISTDFYGCVDTQSVFIDIINALTAPVVTCAAVTTTSLTFGWAAVTGASGYEVSTDNGVTWVPANGTLQHQITGLALGQSVTLLVRGISNCPGIPPSGSQTCTTTPCTLAASLASSTDVTCNTGADGTINVTASGGTTPYSFQIVTGGTTQPTGNFIGLAAGNYIVTVTDVNGCVINVPATLTEPAAITFTTDSTLVSCNTGADGTATITAIGGTGTLTYQWDAAANNQTNATATALTAGTYGFTITDGNSCTATGSAIVTEPTAIVLDSLKSNVSCNAAADGWVQVLVQGGTSPYTYAWSPNANGQTTDSITGLSGGTYSVTVSDFNNCTAIISITITEATAIIPSTTMTQATCNGLADGSATASATGGAGGYTFLWNAAAGNAPTATAPNLNTGTYTVTITDAAGCSVTTTATVTAPPSMTLTTTSVPSTSCSYSTDGSATVTASGGAGGYTYLWSAGIAPLTNNAITGLSTGTTYVTVTDVNGCSDIDSVIINGPQPVIANPIATAISCNGADDGNITLAPTGGTGTLTFAWDNGDNTQNITGLSAGDYIVTITDANNCVFLDTATIVEPDTLQTTATMTLVSCLGGNDGTASALPLGGQGGFSYAWSNTSNDSTAMALTAGTYMVTVTDIAGCTDTASITVIQPATAVSSTISGTNLLCNGDNSGTATAQGTDGTPGAITPYTYIWNTTPPQTTATATGLAAGVHSVTITDGNGCTTTNTITLTEPAVLTGTMSGTPASCFGTTDGTVTIAPTGGTRPYTYAWSAPTVTTDSFAVNLAAGFHFVTVTDANNCTYVNSFEVLQPTQITTTTTVDSVSCFGGSDGFGSVTAAGGNGGFTYAWSDGTTTTANITGLATGWHYVTVTDLNLCSTVDSIQVLEPTDLTASTTVVNVLCNGAATGSATVTGTGGTLSYTYLWDAAAANQTTATAANLIAGTYTVTVTDQNGCTETTTAIITEPATAVSSTISGTNLLCNGDNSGTATAQGVDGTPGATTPYTYAWNDINNQTTATATGLAAGTYIVTITDGNGCTTTNTITLTEPAVLAGTMTGTQASCFGATDGTTTIAATGGTRPYTYAWSAPTVTTDSFAVNLAAGFHFVTVTDANNCTYVNSFEILQPAQIMTATTVIPVACNGDSTGSGTVTVTGGNGGDTYLWSLNNQTTATATGLPAGKHYVTVTDVNGCSTTDSVTVLEPTAITLTTTKVDVGCFGQSTGSATVTPAGGTPNYTYLWDLNAGSQTSQTATNLPAGNFVVTVTDANGCSDTISVTINQPPTGVTITDVSFTQVSCFGGNDGTATVQVTGGAGNYVFNWVGTGQTTQTATGLTIGTYNVVVTDMNGCFAIDSVTIDEPSPITTIFTNVVGSSCNGGADGTATVAASGGVPSGTNGYTYVWNTIPQQQGATATGLSGGQTYMVVVTDANGCTTNNQVVIPQPDPVTLSTTTVNVTCFGFSDGEASVTPVGGTPGYTFLWDVNANNQTTATATGLAAGGYSVTVTDFFGCTKVTSVIITQPAPLSTNETTTDILCKGESTGEAQVLISGGTAPYLILWENNISNPPTDLAVGTYSYTVTDVNNCELIDSITIEEPAMELTATNISTDVICYDDRNGTIEITATGGVSPYKYSLNGTNYDNANTRVGLTAGDYTYYVKDANGCTFTEDVTITEPDEFTVSLGPDRDIQLGDIVDLNVVTTDGQPTYTYLWTPDDGLSCNDCGNPTLDSLQDDRYITVMVTDSRGCEAEDDIYIRISKPRYVFIANAFTPNGDGNNDVLFVQGGNGTEKVLSFRVYDRWGELVYEAQDAPLNDTSFGWDGTYKGLNSGSGVFVWYTEVEFSDGETAVYKGSTVLIK